MDPKDEIRSALGELATAADLPLPQVDDTKMGPLGLTKAHILSAAGMTKIADGVAQLVRAEVTQILSAR